MCLFVCVGRGQVRGGPPGRWQEESRKVAVFMLPAGHRTAPGGRPGSGAADAWHHRARHAHNGRAPGPHGAAGGRHRVPLKAAAPPVCATVLRIIFCACKPSAP